MEQRCPTCGNKISVERKDELSYCKELKILWGLFEDISPNNDVRDLFSIEKEYFIEKDYKAILLKYKIWNILMFPINVLNYFEFKDHFYIQHLCDSINYNWGGTSFDPNISEKTTSFSEFTKKSAKISKVGLFSYLGQDKILSKVISIIREYYHRMFYAKDFRGTGINYSKNPKCNCLGCSIDYLKGVKYE